MASPSNSTGSSPLVLPPASSALEKQTGIIVLLLIVLLVGVFCTWIVTNHLLWKHRWFPSRRNIYYVERKAQVSTLLENFYLQSVLMVKWSLWQEAPRPLSVITNSYQRKNGPRPTTMSTFERVRESFANWVRSIWRTKGTNLMPLVFISLFIGGCVVLSTTLPTINQLSGRNFSEEEVFHVAKKSFAALLLIFIGLLGYYVDRMLKFYKVKFFQRKSRRLFKSMLRGSAELGKGARVVKSEGCQINSVFAKGADAEQEGDTATMPKSATLRSQNRCDSCSPRSIPT